MDASSSALGGMSGAQKDEIMRTVQTQVALANMQELLSVRIRYQSVMAPCLALYGKRRQFTLWYLQPSYLGDKRALKIVFPDPGSGNFR